MGHEKDAHAEYWECVEKVLRRRARNAGLCYDDVEDCLVEFEADKLQKPDLIPDDINTREAMITLRRQIRWFVKSWFRDKKAAAARIEPLERLATGLEDDLVPEIESPEPGPEKIGIQRDDIRNALRVVAGLPENQAWLWRRVVIDGARIVDLAAETGRTTNALNLQLGRIRRKIVDAIKDEDTG